MRYVIAALCIPVAWYLFCMRQHILFLTFGAGK